LYFDCKINGLLQIQQYPKISKKSVYPALQHEAIYHNRGIRNAVFVGLWDCEKLPTFALRKRNKVLNINNKVL